MIKDWLILFRAQTYPATMLCILVPYLYSHRFDIEALILLLMALPLHYFSFGHNSLMDYHYDVRDPHKQHHPLVSGRIALRSGHKAVHSGLCAICSAMAALALLLADNVAMAMASLLLYVVFGHAYNDGLDKNTIHSWIPISICFTSLASFGWFMSHSSIPTAYYLIMASFFLTILFQIGWEGNIKDIWTDPVNLLRELGVKVDGEIRLSSSAMAFSWSITMLKASTIAYLAYFNGLGIPSYLAVCAMIAVMLFFSAKQSTRYIRVGRDDLLKYMSFTEIASIYAIMFSCIDFTVAVLLAIYGAAYFFTINRLIFKFVAPKV